MATTPGLNPPWQAATPTPPGSIAANITNATRMGGLIATITAIIAAVSFYFQSAAQDPVALQVAVVAAKAAVVVASLAVLGVLLAVDVSARASLAGSSNATAPTAAAAAAAAPTAAAPTPAAATAAATAAQPGTSGMIPLSQPLSVRVSGASGPAFAYAARPTGDGKVEYLVARSASQLQWYPQDSIEAT